AGTTIPLSPAFIAYPSPFNATLLAQNIQSALEASLGIGSVVVTPQTTLATNRIYDITFQGKFGSANLPQLGTANVIINSVAAPNAIQVSTVTQGGGSTEETVTFGGTNGGSVQFSYNGVAATGSLTYTPFVLNVSAGSPTAVQLENHLNTIPELNGKVKVINAPGNNNPGGGPFTVIFNGAGLVGTT